MDLQSELNATSRMVREKTPSHVMPTIEAATEAQGCGISRCYSDP
jgi:hypothetical protein